MKILVLFRSDASNSWSKCIISGFLSRGHELKCFSYSVDYHNIYMIQELGITIDSIDRLTDNEIEWADFIFGTDDTVARVLLCKKPIITFNFASVVKNYVCDCGDIMLLPNYSRHPKYTEECTAITIGDMDISNLPQNSVNKQILFIDSGHYPFGTEGKKQLCNFLLRSCEKFRDYKIIIKPRFLYEDKGVTHRNKQHLYDCLRETYGKGGELPSNLVLLDKHENLNVLLSESSVVICMYTTAFFKAAIQGKKAIILDGLTNESAFDLTNEWHWRIGREIYKESGCLVDYKDALNYLPEGLSCNKEFIDKYIPFVSEENHTDKVICMIEYINNVFLSKGKMCIDISTDLKNYSKDLIADEERNWNDIIRRRLRNQDLYLTSRYFDSIDSDISLTDYFKWSKKQIDKVDINNPQEVRKLQYSLKRKRWSIVNENFDKLKGDDRKEAYYLEAQYSLHPGVMSRLSENDYACKSAFWYFEGLYLFEKNDYEQSYTYLDKYLRKSEKTTFPKYVTDKDICVENAHRNIVLTKIPANSRIVIYGAGHWGELFKKRLVNSLHSNVVGIIDKNADCIIEDEIPIISVDRINEISFDYVVISIQEKSILSDVVDTLVNKGISKSQILM